MNSLAPQGAFVKPFLKVFREKLHYFALIIPIREKRANAKTSTQTIVEPIGEAKRSEIIIPTAVQTNERIAAQRVTARKLLKSLIAHKAGKMIRAEIRSAPTNSIEITISIPAIIARREL